MRRLALLLALSVFTALATAVADGTAPRRSAEQEAVVRVVSDAYVDGIHNFRDPIAIRRGFHPDFEMLVLKDGQLEKLPLQDWIARLVAQNEKQAPPTRESGQRSIEARFPIVEVAGTAAFCKVELLRDGKQIFTDYLALYQFGDGWMIVGKSFYRHP